MDLINKESHQCVNALDQMCDSTVPSEIDLITEQGLEKISTQGSASVQNSQLAICAQSYIHDNDDTKIQCTTFQVIHTQWYTHTH